MAHSSIGEASDPDSGAAAVYPQEEHSAARAAARDVMGVLQLAASRHGVRVQSVYDALQESIDQAGQTESAPPSFDAATIQLLELGGLVMDAVAASVPDVTAQTRASFEELRATSLTVDEAASLLGVDPSRVRQRLRARTLFGLREDDAWRLPRRQFSEHDQIRGLARVLPAIRDGLHPVAVWNWLTLPDPDLQTGATSLSPIDWLASGGDIDVVRAIASDL